MLKWIPRAAAFIVIVYLALLGLLILSQILTDYQDVTRTVLALALLPALFFLLIALVSGSGPLIVLTLLAVIASAVIYLPYFVSHQPTAPESAPVITVLTFNIQTPRQNLESLSAVIREANADIVGIQELSPEAAQHFDAALANRYPHRAFYPDAQYAGQGILSRYPILEENYWQNEDVPNAYGQLHVVLDVEGTQISVYSLHPTAAYAAERGLSLDSHSQAVDAILNRVDDNTRALILMGDFNMTSQFDEYNQITAHYTDTYLEAGRGLGFTYPNGKRFPAPPLVRLDYIFHNDAFIGTEAKVWQRSGSADHLPVFATLALLDAEA